MSILSPLIDAIKRNTAARSEHTKTLDRVLAGSHRFLELDRVRGRPQPSDYAALIKRYRAWVYICVSRNASAVSSVPLRLFASRATGQSRARRAAKLVDRETAQRIKAHPQLQGRAEIKAAVEFEEIIEHPFLKLMQNVNDFTNQQEFFEGTETFIELTGDSYWLVVSNMLGIPKELWLLPSQLTRIVPDKELFIKEYTFGLSANNLQRFEPEEVIHFKFFNPASQFYGFGPLEASLTAVDRYSDMDVYEQALSQNNARPDLILQYDGNLGEAQRKELQQDWDRQMRGTRKSGKAKITDKRLTVHEIGFSPREMAFLQGRKWTRLEIADAYGLPLALLDTENVNKANAAAALHQYYKFTITPRLRKIDQKINEKLIPRYNEPRLFVMFDDVVPEDQELTLKQEESDLKNAVRSINQVRLSRGLEPVPWGEVPLVSLTVAPLGTAPSNGSGHLDDDDDKGRHALKTEFMATDFDGCCDHDHRKAHTISAGDEDVDPLTGGPNPSLSSNERLLRDIIQDIWDEQLELALAEIKGIQDFLPIWDKLSEDWQAQIIERSTPVITSVYKRGGEVALVEVNTSIPLWIEKNPAIQKAIDAQTFKFAENTLAQTRKPLAQALSTGIIEGETIPQIRNRVRDVFKGLVTSKRAEMIARSETARATHLGKVQAWKDSGVVATYKWDAVGDACPFCLDMEARGEIPLGDNFLDEGAVQAVEFQGKPITLTQNFGNVVGPPLHPNCRCSLVAVI